MRGSMSKRVIRDIAKADAIFSVELPYRNITYRLIGEVIKCGTNIIPRGDNIVHNLYIY
jgi:hypothetical protein